jgi:transcription factor SPT20
MSTVAVARPSQALRQRRESQRPSLGRTSAAKANARESVGKEDAKRYLWTQQDILAKFKGSPPSLRVHLHANHFRLNDSQESISYASPLKELLQHIRDKTIPHNMLDELYMQGIPFYDSTSFQPFPNPA